MLTIARVTISNIRSITMLTITIVTIVTTYRITIVTTHHITILTTQKQAAASAPPFFIPTEGRGAKMSVFENLCSRIFQEKGGTYAVWIPDGNGGRIRRRANTREKLEKKILSYLRTQGLVETDEKLTVREVFDMFNKERLTAGYVSESTATRDKAFFDKNFRHTPMDSRPMAETTADEWTRFIQASLPGMTAKQWAGFRSAPIRGLLHYAEDLGLIDFTAEDVLSHVRIHKKQFALAAKPKPPESQVFMSDEMAKVKKYCRDHQSDSWCLCLSLIWATGMRVGEAVSLKHNDIVIRPDSLQVFVHRTETQYYDGNHKVTEVKERPKTDAGVRLVSVSETERQLLMDIKKQAEHKPWCFCRLVHGNYIRINAQGVRKKLYRICGYCGIDKKSPHKIRKTVASIMLDNSLDAAFVTGQLGHVELSTTEKYYHRDRRDAAEKSKILSTIAEINE